MTTALSPDLVRRVQQRLAAEGTGPDLDAVARALRAEQGVARDEAEMLALLRGVYRELSGAGPLTGLLADPATTDVVVNGPGDVRVDRGTGWERASVTFPDAEAVTRLARRLAAMAGVRLDDAHPYADGHLPGGVRLHAVLPPLSPAGTYVSLRVLRPARYTLDALGQLGMFPGVSGAAVRALISARLAFLVSGGTGSGKTTLLGAILGAVDPAERIVLVEDAEELIPHHDHLVRLVARGANVEGAGAVSLAKLVRQALRMRPDRLVVGEVRGVEVVDLLAALGTGHEGGAGTVHANSAASVPGRIVALAGAAVPATQVHAQLAQAVQVVLQVSCRGGRRQLTEIAVLVEGSNGQVCAVPAVVDGCPVADGMGHLADRLRERGVDAPW